MVSCPNQLTVGDKKRAWREMLLGNTCRVFLLSFLVVFGFLYVTKTSSLSATGYKISDLEKQISTLEHENQKIEFEIAKNSSLKNIESRIQQMNLVMADKVEYVTLLGNSVARR